MKAHWLDDESALLSREFLAKQGVLSAHLELEGEAYRGALDDLKQSRGYTHQDEVALSEATPNLAAICEKFAGEHHHDEDEVRFVLDGAGIFDIRSGDDRWMRVVVERGDLIVVPEKRHHRFMLTERNQIRCVRLFKDSTGWTPHYREPRG